MFRIKASRRDADGSGWVYANFSTKINDRLFISLADKTEASVLTLEQFDLVTKTIRDLEPGIILEVYDESKR